MDQNYLNKVAYNWKKKILLSIYLLGLKDYNYVIKIKTKLNIVSSILWDLINLSIKKISSLKVALGHLLLKFLTETLIVRQFY